MSRDTSQNVVYLISVAMTQSVSNKTFIDRPVNNEVGVRMRWN
jgi:hypothetical protein